MTKLALFTFDNHKNMLDRKQSARGGNEIKDEKVTNNRAAMSAKAINSEFLREKDSSFAAVSRITMDVQLLFADNTNEDGASIDESQNQGLDVDILTFDAIDSSQKKLQLLLKKLETLSESWESHIGKEIEEPTSVNFQLRLDGNDLEVILICFLNCI